MPISSPYIKQKLRRLAAELLDLLRHPTEGISALPNDGNLFEWTGTIQGPQDSPYADGLFTLQVKIPEDYPLKAPRVIFDTKVYHPNVDSDSGFISLSVLGDEWSPALTISTILLSIQAYLTEPDTIDPIMPEIAHEYENDRATYERKAMEWTKKYADRPEETEHLKTNEPAQALSIGYQSTESERIAGR